MKIIIEMNTILNSNKNCSRLCKLINGVYVNVEKCGSENPGRYHEVAFISFCVA